MKHRILLVDDETHILDALERLFRQKYHILKASSGAEGLEILKTERPTVIISDQRMPLMNGVEFLAQSMDLSPDSIRILLTGYTDIESVIEAINLGQIYRYVTKPWEAIDLTNAVEQAVEKYELRQELEDKNKQLEIAYNELKTLDQSKTHFMYLINHELKTPLTVISSYTQLLAETELDDMQKKSVQRIDQGQNRLQSLINDVLQVVEAETGQAKINPEVLDLEKIIQEVLIKFETEVKNKSIEIEANYSIKKVLVDKKIVENLVNRLVDNAIKFSDKNKKIKLFAEAHKNGFTLQFTNTGKAFPEEKIQQLLKPFAIDENILNHSLGTGLGLSICNAYMTLLKGHLQITTNGPETKITLLFPQA